MDAEFKELGIDVDSEELFELFQGNNVHPEISKIQIFQDPTTKQFDRSRMIQYMKSLESDQNAEAREQWLGFEDFIRNLRKNEKYNRLVEQGMYVNSSEAQLYFNQGNEKISFEYVSIPFHEILDILSGGNSSKSSWDLIILHFRLPKAITAILVGSGLAIAGLLMQTLFRNPLAGPFVLGISSGASLGVALLILGSGIFGGVLATIAFSSWGLAIASSIGAALVLLAVLVTATKVRNTMSILIIGLMFGTVTSAIISVLTFFSDAEIDFLTRYSLSLTP